MADPIATIDPVRTLPYQLTGPGGAPVADPSAGGGTMIPGATAGQDWTAILGSLLGGARALTGRTSIDPQPFMDRADPYGPSRSQWWPQIQQLMADPTSALKDPSFTAPLKLGGESLARQFGSMGMGISGNEDAALQDYGQTQGMNFIQQRLNNLINLGGVNAGSPAAAAQIGAGLTQGNQDARTQGLTGLSGPLGALLGGLLGPAGSALGGLGGIISKIFGGGGGTFNAGTGGLQTGEGGTLGSADWEGANSSIPGGTLETGGFQIPSDEWGDIDWSQVFTD